MTTRRTLARLGATAAGTSVLALGLVAPASAHVTVTPSDTAAGAYTVLTFSVGHGCEGSPTTSIAIQIPEGINAATPTRNEFYDVEKTVEKLDPPVTDAHGNELTERVSTVTYTAKTALPDGYRDTFEVQVQIPEDAEGTDLAFPTIQTCEKGETPWTQIAAEGQTEDDLESPAPAFEVTAAGADAHGSDEEATEDDATAEDAAAETSSDTSASGEPTSEAADDDSGNGLAIAGLVAGIAGILVGGFALLRGRSSAA